MAGVRWGEPQLEPPELRAVVDALRRLPTGADRRAELRGPGQRAGANRGHASPARRRPQDRKSTRLNSSHDQISYAVFCLKKKINGEMSITRIHKTLAALRMVLFFA